MEEFNVLISSAGRRVELINCFRESINELGLQGRVVAADMSRYSPAFQLADAAEQVPRCTSNDFIPEIDRIVRKHHISLVIPTIDTELPAFSKHRSRLEELGTTVHVSSPQSVEICLDKRRTRDWLFHSSIPVPSQMNEPSMEKFENEGWKLPVLVKPVAGSASIGVRVINTKKELEAELLRDGIIIQEIATGVEYTVDVYVDRNGVCRCQVPRLRMEVRAGEISKGITEKNHALMETARNVVESLPEPWGVMCVQMFYDREKNDIRVIEINPRFGGGYPLSHRAGAVFTSWLIMEAQGMPLNIESNEWTENLVMLRYDQSVFRSRESL